MVMRRKYLFISAVAAALLIIGGVIILATNNTSDSPPPPAGKLKIEGFNSEGVCAALMPSCGYCPGQESASNCYVTQEEFNKYKQHYPNVKATN
jgi:hypothetical protein